MEHRFIPNRILDYCDDNSSPIGRIPEEILGTMSDVPRGSMMVGKHVARLLQAIAFLRTPQQILEIGTFHGFSAAAIAETLSPGMQLVCCERDPIAASVARQHLQSYLSGGQVTLLEVDGMEYLDLNNIQFDMIFIDADKHSFCSRLDLLFDRLAPNGVLVIDNALAGLAVLEGEPKHPWEAMTKFFNSKLADDPRFFVTQVPLRDGITLAIKRDLTP